MTGLISLHDRSTIVGASRILLVVGRSLTSLYADIGRDNKVLHHSEAHTHSAFWFKKKVYLVLTEGHIVQFKNQTKASELFHR